MLLLLFHILASAIASAAGGGPPVPEVPSPLSYFCTSTGEQRTFLPNSTFEANLAKLSVSFPANASASGGFVDGSIGAGPDTVYALALCRGDTAAANCTACLEAAFRNARDLCPYNKDVTVYQEQCQVRVSDLNILDLGANQPTSEAWDDTGDDVPDPIFFGWEWGPHGNGSIAFVVAGIVSAFLEETALLAAYNQRPRRFGTAALDSGEASPTFHSMAQCTPDLSATSCVTCLENIITQNTARIHQGRKGGRFLGVRCSFRYGSYFADGGEPMQIIMPTLPHGRQIKNWSKLTAAIAVVVLVLMLLVLFFLCFGRIRSRRKALSFGKLHAQDEQEVDLHQQGALVWTMEGSVSSEFWLFDSVQIQVATNNFSEENKLGQGGFGPVYKGTLPDGLDIAVKRLSANSGQGFIEFKNEAQLIAKLQHTNLVRLLGCCSQGKEKMLVYEYLPNKSLDYFIFDITEKRALLDWTKRFKIIQGISQGLLYLHRHSRLRIIHRDLKATNILLDQDMNPKISDFGIAKIFISHDIEDNTNTVAGTYGYMAPEYAYEGFFSSKSDVFSFGVLLLEIVSGKRNSIIGPYGGSLNLLGYAWLLWKEGKWHELVDTSLAVEKSASELIKCINIALLCVQENANDRPTMSDVTRMLDTEGTSLPQPKHPAYYNVEETNLQDAIDAGFELQSINGVTITTQEAR
ncbi:hypothetical protein QOZ80_1BG0069640 [Eleusine coracana subsp. coracana]|nr:hypothetical protein QOZ80_1BG0069640 [Eleusine coracana subsp. coracana]